ncbi:MAG: aminotransferase class V-fold PLP-dependent enzyme [Acidobacteria bacterium]|nr:aminotransferase class V-fold PLP-dependent enzyme [Acidobacteriota bacterium]
MNRRSFIVAAAVCAAFRNDALERVQAAAPPASRPSEEVARDEDFWFQVRHAFTIDRGLINLNNGGVSPAPRVVQDAMNRYLTMQNMNPVYYMWRILDPQVEGVRRELAKDFGCDTEEIAITRNASEALEICQQGLDFKPGDEVVTTNQDYPRMITTWEQRVKRDGIVLKMIEFPAPPPGMDDLAERFEKAITPKTRAILVSHITNRTGQIFPVQRICRMARARGIETIVDGAHSYAHFPFKRDDLDCDYFGTSLHKWLLAPIGTGMLYVRKEKIAKLWPMMGAEERLREDIRKFEQIGTHPAANRLAIGEALTFHQSIGVERKVARLRYLRERWSRRLEQLPGVRSLTPDDPEQAAGLGLLAVNGIEATDLSGYLFQKHKIVVTTVKIEGEFPYQGIRITPNIYTTLGEIDALCEGVEQAVRRGV